MGATSNALLPFAFACFVDRGNRWRAAAVLLLLLLFYPITLTKLTLFAPFWLLFLALLSRFLDSQNSRSCCRCFCRLIGRLSLSCAVRQAGVLRYRADHDYFGAVNFRMMRLPSVALDYYNDFFSTHAHTYFCQISFLETVRGLPLHRVPVDRDGEEPISSATSMPRCSRPKALRPLAWSWRRLRRSDAGW